MTNSFRVATLTIAMSAAACVSYEKDADTSAAQQPAAIDTLKAAPAPADSIRTDTAGDTSPAGGSKTPAATGTKTSTKARADTPRVYRDSVIMPKRSGGLPPIKPDSL